MNHRSTPIFPSRSQRAARVLGVAAMLCAPCVFAPATWAAEQTVVIPVEYATKEGEGKLADVFFNNRPTIRYQQVYDSFTFQSLSADSIQIIGMRFRVNGPGIGSFSAVIPTIEIRLSTSTRNPAQMSANFVENVGLDETVVLAEGPLQLSGQAVGAAPQPFNVEVRFEQSFWYDPRAGHLLIDILRAGPGSGEAFDLDLGYFTTGFAIGSYGSSTATVVNREGGLVTQLMFNKVPEPSVWALAGLGCLVFCYWKRKA
jgi:hypothetical protein